MSSQKLSSSLHLRADATREKILKSARLLFVQHGFAGASMGKIATKAGINHSLLFHHYRNKEGLWQAVKQKIVTEAKRKMPTLPKLNHSFTVFLKKLITQNISFYRNNPDIISMINWQRVEYHHQKEIGITLSTESKAWLEALQYYQKKGDIHTSLKLEFVLTFILSVISSAAMDPYVFIKKTSQQKSYIQFCVKNLVKAFR